MMRWRRRAGQKEDPSSGSNGNGAPKGLIMRYALFSYHHPFATFFTIGGVLIVIAVIAGMVMKIEDGEGDEWIIKDHKHTKRDQAISEALDELGEQVDQLERSEDSDALNLVFVYRAKDKGKNVFTKENLESIREVENLVLQHANYTDFCQIDHSSKNKPCMKPISPLLLFYDYNEKKPTFKGPKLRQTIDEGLAQLRENFFQNAFLVDTKFKETNRSEFTRSKFFIGLPIPGYDNSKTKEDDQEDKVMDEFIESLEEDLWDLLGMKASMFRTEYSDVGKIGTVEVVFSNEVIEAEEGERVVWIDFGWAGAAILFVWVYELIHLGSVFLATVGVFEVFMAFPLAIFFYKLVFQIEFFNEMNFLVIFILLGIGADDVFVFADAFKQSPAIPGVGHSLKARLMYSTERASKAIFVTSFTTMAAFFATAMSSLMPMQAFGIFAAICIIFLFLINVVFMPPALVLWSGYTITCVEKFCCCFMWLHEAPCCLSLKRFLPCCTCCHYERDETFHIPVAETLEEQQKKAGSSHSNGEPASNVLDGVKEQEMVGMKGRAPGEATETAVVNVPGPDDEPPPEDVTKLRALERFYNGPYFNFIRKTRFIFLVLGICVLGAGIGIATQFEAPEEAEQWWPDFHSFGKFYDYIDRTGPFEASKDDWIATVHLAWGLKGMDTSNIDRWNAEDFGTLEYDQTFDMTSKKAQEHMLGVCPQVREGRCRMSASECKRGEGKDEAGYLVLLDRTSDIPLREQAPCWIEAFDDWLRAQKDPKSLPLPPNEFMEELVKFTNETEARLKYQEHIGIFDENGEKKLRFVQFEFDSTYRPPAPYSRTIKVVDSWEDLMVELNRQAVESEAEGVSRGFLSGRETWTWIFTQRMLLRNAVQGIILVFAIAFVVLNIATGNIVISALAILTLIGIVATVMGIGIRGIMGWKMGIAESIVSVILIGFAMDYSLHLADSYIESERKDRVGRTQDSLTHLGISVTAGAITTLGSGLFLWGAIFIFFTKFAFNITATILASFLWSMLFFPSLCLTFGPEGNFGNWSTMLGCVRERFRR